jgi:hypothetical protein
MAESKKCKGLNRNGKRCGTDAVEGSKYCVAHQDQAPKLDNNLLSYKKLKIFIALGSLFYTLLIGFIGYILYPKINDIITAPLSVSPEEIEISSKYGKLEKGTIEFPFSLINERNRQIYGAWLKLIPIGPPDMSSFIEAVPTTVQPRKVIIRPKTILYKNMAWMKAFDESGIKCIWFYIHDIEPLQTIPFKLRVITPDILQKQSAELKVKLKLAGKYYSKMPSPITFEEDSPGDYKVSMTLTPPENIKRPGKYGPVRIPNFLE